MMTVPIKSDGLSCLPSYRSREETIHTRVIQHASQERKCNDSEFDEEDSCLCCWWSRSWGRGRGGRGRSKELLILDHSAVGEDVVEPLTRSPSSSPQISPTGINERHEHNGVEPFTVVPYETTVWRTLAVDVLAIKCTTCMGEVPSLREFVRYGTPFLRTGGTLHHLIPCTHR